MQQLTLPLELPHSEPFVVALPGCAPEPLLAYLKALGIFRVVAEQKDPRARAFWGGDLFHLRSRLDADELCQFFLDGYQPSPIVSPWNGGSGFFAKDNQEALNAIGSSTSPRLEAYRTTIGVARRVLGAAAATKPDGKAKQELIQRLRTRLPDVALPWLDANASESSERVSFSPLLGTGGNDGRLEFSQNYLQRVRDVILTGDRVGNAKRLRLALFGVGEGTLIEAAVGQFDPGGVGGPNARPGFEAVSLVNPWDFVLMIEGTLFFLGSVARRFAGTPETRASFPFTVHASAAGTGALASGDDQRARAEIWLPLWPRPSGLTELRQLFAEGRAQVGRRSARTGVDFARAVVGLGVDRGISAFQRYGFLQRSGKGFLAVPLGQIAADPRESVHLLDEMDGWLSRLRRLATTDGVPARYRLASRAVEEAIFAYCQFGGARRLQNVLAAFGAAERSLAIRGPGREKISPLQGLSARWISAGDDGSSEFRIAVALASIDGAIGPIRGQLEAVKRRGNRWEWSEGDRGVIWAGGDLARNLATVLARRQIEVRQARREGATATGPNPELRASYAVPLGDIARFLAGTTDDARVGNLLWALAALRWDTFGREYRPRPPASDDPADLPRAYALLKLLYLTVALPTPLGEPVVLSADPAILARLESGDLDGATRLAYQRIRAHGLSPLGGSGPQHRQPPDVFGPPAVTARLAGALLIPTYQTDWLVRLALRSARSDNP